MLVYQKREKKKGRPETHLSSLSALPGQWWWWRTRLDASSWWGKKTYGPNDPLHARGSKELTSEFLGIKKKTYGPNDGKCHLGPLHARYGASESGVCWRKKIEPILKKHIRKLK
jgi:hypothetical protein